MGMVNNAQSMMLKIQDGIKVPQTTMAKSSGDQIQDQEKTIVVLVLFVHTKSWFCLQDFNSLATPSHIFVVFGEVFQVGLKITFTFNYL